MSDDTKNLFDHIWQIKTDQDPKYWNKLDGEEKSNFSRFMTERYLSMNPDFAPIISQLKPFTREMEDRHVYRLYAELLPPDYENRDYISNSNKQKFDDELVEKLASHFEVSEREVCEYLDVIRDKKGGKSKIKQILRSYGVDDGLIQKVDKL